MFQREMDRQDIKMNADPPCEASAGAVAGFLDDFAPEFDSFLDDVVAEHGAPPPRAPDRRQRETVPFVEDSSLISPLPDSIAEAGRWRTLLAGGWSEHRNIHIQEARIALLGLRRDSRRTDVRNCELLSLGDNLSEVLSFERGRSRDYGLNALARRACAYQISMNVRWRRRYIETAWNASDADSRLADRQIISAGGLEWPAP